MNSSGCYIDSQSLWTAGKYLFPGFCRPGIFRFAGIFRVLWISHRNIGGEWQDVFRLADRSRIGRTTTEQGAAARMRTDLKTVAGAPPLRQICRMRLLRSHADTRLPAIGEGEAVAAQWQIKNRSRLSISCDFISVCPGQGSIRANRYKWLNFRLFYNYLFYSILKFIRMNIDLFCFRCFS